MADTYNRATHHDDLVAEMNNLQKKTSTRSSAKSRCRKINNKNQFPFTKTDHMSLETLIMADMKDAMKAKDEAALRGLRTIKAEIIKQRPNRDQMARFLKMRK